MSLSPGTRLGPYEILSSLGVGGMGEVYKARDTRLDRIVAIKMLKGGHAGRFRQEARAIAALNHPNICTLYDVGDDYLVMEYLEGASPTGPMPLADALDIAAQIADALDFAHRHGILHRDLKLSNVLITASGAKLLDFGLAKHDIGPADNDATQTSAGAILGTAAYMSPEQAKGLPVDERSDIYSFGALLYELLAGNTPFGGGSTAEVLSAVIRDTPAPLQSPAAAVVTRCLSKLPQDRFLSMGEVKTALNQLAASKPARNQPSIAVLPFANMSADKEQEYFSDGLTEEIINALVKVPGLKVIARTSAFAFKGQNTDIRRIAGTLGVTTVLEGSVRRSGGRIRVTAQLIAAADGTHLWSERYDREMAGVFEVQDEISAAIARALEIAFSPEAVMTGRHTPPLSAHEALLKARHFHMKLTPESMSQARAHYLEAIALDSDYALAHAYYADWLLAGAVIGMAPGRHATPAARAMAERALELDPSLPEAHAILCVANASYDYDWGEAARRAHLTTSIGAVSPMCHFLSGMFYHLAAGRWQGAVDHLTRAVQGDPLNPTFRQCLAYALSSVERHAEAERHLRQNFDLNPNFYWSYAIQANLYAARQLFTEALPYAEKACSLGPWHSWSIATYAGLLVRTGQEARGREVAQKLHSREAGEVQIAWMLFYCYCGELDAAMEWAEKAIEDRHPEVPHVLQSVVGEPLRTSPHWPKLAARMNLPVAGSPSHPPAASVADAPPRNQ
jgi:eukaryotic-like serine/threonine-protein kinase